MSRSKKGKKPVGYDFWSKRPNSSKNDKDLTHKAERKQGKSQVKKGLKEGSE